jgi:Zn finger protein HypA/HybF involved in hydrogenase expression
MEECLAELAKVELQHISFKVHCVCGKSFIAEDFEPECPHCDRIYSIKMLGNKKELNLLILK